MRKTILLFLILGILFISACKEKCDSGLYTSDGECCTYICKIECENGYKEGTCNCECKETTEEDTSTDDTNIDDIFDSNDNIEPPSIPI